MLAKNAGLSALAALLLLAGSAGSTPDAPPGRYQELFEMREARGPALPPEFDYADDESGYDALYYNLEIRFTIAPNVTGRVDMDFAVTAATLTSLPLDFYYTMVVDCVLVDGQEATFTLAWQDNFTINLPQALAAGDTARATIFYHGVPIPGNMGAMSWQQHGNPPVTIISSLSQPEGARTWWPCKDQPHDKADSVRMVWTVPNNFTATGNGLLRSATTPEPGWKAWEWVEKYPISTYLVAVTATNFAHFRDWYVSASGDSLPLDHYVYPEDSADATIAFSNLPDIIGFYASVFGEYPFMTEKYGHVAFPFGGAMEHQTLTSYGAQFIVPNHNYTWLTAHELAHQWWGDMTTCETWMDIWLNEGVATYCDALYTEFNQGWAAFQERMEENRDTYFWYDSTSSSWGEGRFPIYDPEYMWGGTVYDKGSWIVHMLRYVLGEDDFWDFWLLYRDRFAFDAVTTAEFQQTLEDASGQDLDWFFDEWVYMAGYPEYHWGWQQEAQGEDSSRVDLSIRQVQELVNQTPIFTMPIPVRVITTSSDEVIILDNHAELQNYSVTVPGQVLDVLFDPDEWILKIAQEEAWVGVEEEPAAQPRTAVLLELGQNPVNPTARIYLTLPRAQDVTLAVYNLAGQRVATLLDGPQAEGRTALTWDASGVASGMYLVRLDTPTDHQVRKLAVVK
ncbi:MAG: T9SS C-terminal target domain-containing protein [Candidatus Zixiibacteriota bacterium]|nr:MAG: T9SS C-terminal target domain-containing protein [candidate division Zixibacteria bacterium]